MTSTAAGPATRGAEAPQAADVLVIFGITGDLAKVMTFRSLYRLERRGLLDCPIVGVAVDDWTVPALVEHARAAIEATGEPLDEAVFERFAARFSYVAGDFADAAHLRARRRAARRREEPRLLPRDPAVPVRRGREGARRGRPDGERPGRGREAVRPRPRVGARARRRAPPVPRRVAALPDRPLPREDGARGAPLPPVREHDARAGLEPQLRRVRPDHDGRELRRRGPRPLLRPGRRAARRRRQPPDAGGRGGGDGAAGRGDPKTIKDAQLASSARSPTPIRRTTCAVSTTATATIDGVAPDSTTETYAALRLEIDNWRWSGVPFFIRTGKRLPATQTELRLVFKHAPKLGWRPGKSHRPEPNQLVVKLDPSTGSPHRPRRAPRGLRRAGAGRARRGVRRAGRRGRDAVRGAAARGDGRRQHPLHAAGRRRGDLADHAAAARRAAARAPVRAGDVGARRPPTRSSPATAAGTSPGCTP